MCVFLWSGIEEEEGQREREGRRIEKTQAARIYSYIMHYVFQSNMVPAHTQQALSLLLCTVWEWSVGRAGTAGIELEEEQIHPPLSCSCSTLFSAQPTVSHYLTHRIRVSEIMSNRISTAQCTCPLLPGPAKTGRLKCFTSKIWYSSLYAM